MKKSKIKFIKNVIDPIHCGWVDCLSNENEKIVLPYTTKVEHISSSNEFETIRIMEGNYKNKIVDIPFLSKNDDSNYSYLVNKINITHSIPLILDSSQLILGNRIIDVIVEKNAFDKKQYFVKFPVKSNRILPKIYFDERHGGSRFSRSWFPILADGEFYPEKYLHFGTYSKGCITVKYLSNQNNLWNDLYFNIVNSRLDDQNLGLLLIK
jgi:hypothetical protein